MRLADAFAATLAALDPPQPFALAVSGGPDSVALMRLAAPLKPLVLTVDHGLRDGSADEARQVAAWAADQGLTSLSRRWEGAKPTAGIQAAARTARYRLLAEMATATGAQTLLTGHTLDDQFETIAMRRTRGSGPLGLAGMPSQATLPGSDLRLVRPLLATPKAALITYLEGLGQGFLSDPSNRDPRFDRARLRQSQSGAPDLAALVTWQEARIAAERTALDFLDTHAASLSGNRCLLARSALGALPDTNANIILGALLRRAGGRDYPGTAAERGRLLAAIRADAPFPGRTLAHATIRLATRAEGGEAGAPALVFARESGHVATADWWLPFGQFPQLLADGRIAR